MKHDEIIKLEELATQLSGIKPIIDREYQHIDYQKIHLKKGIHRIIQKRSNMFKTSRKRI